MNMKKYAYGFIGAGVLMIAAQCPAQGRVGYVDIEKVARKAPQVTKAMSEAQEQVSGLQDDLEAKRKQIRGLEADVKKSEGVLSKDELDKRRKELDKLKNELDELDLKARRKIQRVDEDVFAPTMDKITAAVQDVAKERKLDIVVRKEAVWYGDPAMDITEAVITRLSTEDRTAGTARPDTRAEKPETSEEKPAKPAEIPADTPTQEPKAEVTATPAPPPPVAQETPVPEEKVQAAPEPKETPAKSGEKPDADEDKPKSDSKTGKTAAPKTPGTRPVDRQPE